MSSKDLKLQIADILAPEVGMPEAEFVELFETPRQEGHGDIALPCFRFAKQLRKPPPQIAQELANKLESAGLPAAIREVNPVAGFLNFTLDASVALGGILERILTEGADFASSDIGRNKKVIVEFSSVNIAKPFGIGHLRSTILGAALARIYDKLGYQVIRINHLGDWGTQFGNLIAAYRMWGDEYDFEENPIQDLYQLYVRFHEAAEEDEELAARGREEFRKLESGDAENVRLWERFIEYSMIDFRRVYETLHVDFDYYTGESFYRDKLDRVVGQLEEKNLLRQSEGATIVDLEKFDMPPCLIKKSDESSLYATRDLAALLYRKEHFDFDKIFYVVGSAQQLHFRQFFKVAELMGHKWVKNAEHVEFGWVKFGDKAMSTRSGTLIFFDDVFQQAKRIARQIIEQENPDVEDIEGTAREIAVAAIAFTQLKVRRTKDVNFIWEEALSFKGETGPYLQYTHARLTSLSQKYGKKLPDPEADFSLLGDDEKQVVKWFELYPDKLKAAAESYETLVLAEYLINLASAFNSYWQRVRIITDDEPLTRARMQMAHSVRLIIADGLQLLGIKPLERM